MSWLRLLLAGVGGQGVLSMGRWIGEAAHAAGLQVVVQQRHGLSQRGGSVCSAVIIGGARSPEIADGMADILLALEPMEAARQLAKVSSRTTAIINTQPIVPRSLLARDLPYPALVSLLAPLQKAAGSLVTIDATALATAAGAPRSVNVVMLGLLAGTALLPFPGEHLLKALPAGSQMAEANRRGFQLGREQAPQQRGAG